MPERTLIGAARVGLLLGLVGAIAWNLASGQVYLYVNERSVWLVALGAAPSVGNQRTRTRKGVVR